MASTSQRSAAAEGSSAHQQAPLGVAGSKGSAVRKTKVKNRIIKPKARKQTAGKCKRRKQRASSTAAPASSTAAPAVSGMDQLLLEIKEQAAAHGMDWVRQRMAGFPPSSSHGRGKDASSGEPECSPGDKLVQDITALSSAPQGRLSASRKRHAKSRQLRALANKKRRPVGPRNAINGPRCLAGASRAVFGFGEASTAPDPLATASTAPSAEAASNDMGRGEPQNCDTSSSSDCSDTEWALAKSLCSFFRSLQRRKNARPRASAAVAWGPRPVREPERSGQVVTEAERVPITRATPYLSTPPSIPVLQSPANSVPTWVPAQPPVDVYPPLAPAILASQNPAPQVANNVLGGVTSLADSVPAAIKERIWKREYIDIFSLLITDVEVEPEKGESSEVKEERPRVDKNIQNWVRAFHVFMSVIVEREPEHYPVLIRYMDTIMTAQRRGGWAWLNYDIHFRKSMAHNPAVSWQHRSMDLWLDEMTLQKPSWAERAGPSYSYARERGPFQGAGRWEICKQFNAGHCKWKNCKLSHICSTCGFGSHPAIQCRTSRDHRPSPRQQPRGKMGRLEQRFPTSRVGAPDVMACAKGHAPWLVRPRDVPSRQLTYVLTT
ncbi:uncharacterized protein LOC115083560 [Rhinatrema bivittatum]|uniref:uncharacterized protein LOC115083560 n=1 Tax=Rhinatrema bivittatum TaxID=194408 RepID=UPI00112BA3D3|nr:uncharacterized protein LOC115083560 [Rhinatrema bivittatum]